MIATPRLTLRPPRLGDLAALHRVFSEPRAMRYWNHAAHVSLDETRAALTRIIESYHETGLEFVLEHKGAVIGKAGMWRLGEIGYILHPAYWRRGLASEALEALLPACFARYPTMAAIRAEIDPRNAASAALLARFGFVETHRAARTIEVGGEWCDSAYWRLDRPGPISPAG